jgi:hypothetical protein
VLQRWKDILISMFVDIRVRGVAILLSAVFLVRLFPVTGPKVLAVLLLVPLLSKLFDEWRVYIRPFRKLMGINRIRAGRALKRFRRVPPDVPLLYGAVAMLMLVWMGVSVFYRPLAGKVSMANAMAVVVSVGAIRHGFSAIKTVAKWAWGRAVGKVLYVGAFSMALWLGRSDACEVVRELTHADAKYYPTFVGLMSSLYVLLRMMQFGTLLVSVCAMLLLIAVMPRLILGVVRGHFQGARTRLFTWSVAGSTNRAQVQNNRDEYQPMLPELIALLTPIGLSVVALQLYSLPDWGVSLMKAYNVPARILVATEYVADGDCSNVAADEKTVHLGDALVSIVSGDSGQPVFSKVTCNRDIAAHSATRNK